jgi:predicted nuclease of predicted toxin-antitoxin system
VTLDRDFGQLLFAERLPSCGLVRLPDVPAAARIALLRDALARWSDSLASGAVVTIRGGRIRVSFPPCVS